MYCHTPANKGRVGVGGFDKSADGASSGGEKGLWFCPPVACMDLAAGVGVRASISPCIVYCYLLLRALNLLRSFCCVGVRSVGFDSKRRRVLY